MRELCSATTDIKDSRHWHPGPSELLHCPLDTGESTEEAAPDSSRPSQGQLDIA